MSFTGLQRAIVMEHAEEIADQLPTRAAALRAVLELVATQAAVIARYQDGWKPTTADRGYWLKDDLLPASWELMTDAEQQVIYGEVTR
jgi:hypothetical protein